VAGVRVEIWSDVVCPWCYIGKRRFEHALAELGDEADVEIVWRSFELDPDAPRVQGEPALEHLAQKYGMTLAQAEAAQARVTQAAAGEGLDYHLADTQRGNSFDAHRLIHLARSHGLQDEMKERFLRAYFTEGQRIGDPETLARLAVEAGLDPAEVDETLATGRFADEVREDERRARLLGINGVPFFVLDERLGVSGAQPAEVFVQALRQAAAQAIA
jgi:predicted DsbA family dithiol-disulfide isomerase